MQAFSFSSSHGSSICNTKPSLRFQKTPFKPDSPRHLDSNHTSTSSTSLSAKITASHDPNPIPNRLTWHDRSNSRYFLPPPLCGNSSNALCASDNSGSNRGKTLRGLVEVVGEATSTAFPISNRLTWHDRSNSRYFLPPLLCGNSSNTLSASENSGSNSGRNLRGLVEGVGEAISTAFPIWVALGCFLGLVRPDSYNWVQPKWTMMGITFTMLGMGMTLTFDDLKGALAMPKELLTGFFLQYSIMPLSGFFISKILNLPSHYAAGLILVGCCPGGTASNIVTYIARGNVALSVLMTAASTVSAVVMTPFLTAKLAGQYVAVDAIGLLMSTLQVVLLPVLVGAFMNQYFKKVVKFVSPLMPPIAVATVAVLCGNAIAQSSSAILVSGQQVVLAAVLLHVSGFFFGYSLSRILGVDVSSSRTISIEVGMQNSVLGVVLATQHFGNPLTAVPCAVSSVCHSILGSALAGVWRRMKPATQEVKHNP